MPDDQLSHTLCKVVCRLSRYSRKWMQLPQRPRRGNAMSIQMSWFSISLSVMFIWYCIFESYLILSHPVIFNWGPLFFSGVHFYTFYWENTFWGGIRLYLLTFTLKTFLIFTKIFWYIVLPVCIFNINVQLFWEYSPRLDCLNILHCLDYILIYLFSANPFLMTSLTRVLWMLSSCFYLCGEHCGLCLCWRIRLAFTR